MNKGMGPGTAFGHVSETQRNGCSLWHLLALACLSTPEENVKPQGRALAPRLCLCLFFPSLRLLKEKTMGSNGER